MKEIGFYILKFWVKCALFFYYRSIKLVGNGHMPNKAPVLLLSNHQNALMDILLIATQSNRKLWYLARADIFKNKLFRPLFSFLQMLPVYRIRDGRANLSKNKNIFKTCGSLLNIGEAILLFPEGNHSLKRRVRPLSKGFTRIIEEALKNNPDSNLQLVALGQNYQTPRQAGDRAVLFMGRPKAVQDFKSNDFEPKELKQHVFYDLVKLTTHIEETNYDDVVAQLEIEDVDFTQPIAVNSRLNLVPKTAAKPKKLKSQNVISRGLFTMVNLPFILLWRLWIKPKVPEPEFEATFRFVYALIVYTIGYLLIMLLVGFGFSMKLAAVLVLGHMVCNLLFVKLFGITN